VIQAVIYARVSTDDQNTERQVRDLMAFAERCGYEVIAIHKETASGGKNDRAERKKVMALAQARKIQAVLVTEMSRWGRSLPDLLDTLGALNKYGVSLVAQTGMTFDLTTPQGKLMAGILGSLAEFEKDLLRERTMSGLAAARAKGRVGGRRAGFNPSDKYVKRVLQMIDDGRSYRWIAHELQISPTTVMQIVKRHSSAA
jgi:DNA invertase Pin-like site-specific DNA recombinase